MKNRRDIILLIGLFATLIVFLALSSRLRPPDADPSFPTTHSREPAGAQALYRWLGDLGYAPRRLEYRAFALDEADNALIMLNPSELVTNQQAEDVLAWVERGGTLILADDTGVSFGPRNELLEKLNVSFEVYTTTEVFEQPIQQVQPRQPLFAKPPVAEARANTGRFVRAPDRNDLVTLAGTETTPTLVGLARGRGYIYLSSATYPFTNAGLRDAGNGGLVLNLLRRVPKSGRIQFDEYHLGYFEPPSTPSVVFSNPFGWAAAYAVLATGLFLVLSGRRFGTPIPLKAEVARRSSAEYVTSIADLLQRGNKRSYIAQHYYTAFKRTLARRNGLNARLDDTAFVQELQQAGATDSTALLELLSRLRIPSSDDALISAVTDAQKLLEAQ